jgi:hypothetical protein
LAVLSFIINTPVSIDDYWSPSPRRGDCPEGDKCCYLTHLTEVLKTP